MPLPASERPFARTQIVRAELVTVNVRLRTL
jgi:hypothetical protein